MALESVFREIVKENPRKTIPDPMTMTSKSLGILEVVNRFLVKSSFSVMHLLLTFGGAIRNQNTAKIKAKKQKKNATISSNAIIAPADVRT